MQKRGGYMNSLEIKICDIQGRLFELSLQVPYSSDSFIKAFMNSELALHLDSGYNRMQWAGEEYLLEELLAEQKEYMKEGEHYSQEILYWTGYLYRYWHYYTGENSKKIYRQAGVKTMKRNYMMFHTLDPEIAVDDLKEIYRQKYK